MMQACKAKILLISHPLCIHCPKAEQLLNEMGLEYEKVLINTVEGKKIAEKYEISMVPSIVIEYNGSTRILQGYSESLRPKLSRILEEVV